MSAPESSATADAVLVAFLQQYLADLAEGRKVPLEGYQRQYPGFEEQIAAEHARLSQDDPCEDDTAGRFADGEEIGRGGMGVVRRIFDETLRRQLAVKLLRRSIDDDAMRSRFTEEARITGQLSHPGVVPVHEFGAEDDGRPFFTMPLIRGRSFSDIIVAVHSDDAEWTLPRALSVLLRVCETIAYAHDKGVIHRDLKPSNVMVGEFGEAYVMDWGLARTMRSSEGADPVANAAVSSERAEIAERDPSSPLLTADGQVVGTPAYMAPEQARGGPIDERTDVFAIGAMLYHLLAGSRPYAQMTTSQQVLDAVLEGPPESLTERAPRAAAELLAIVGRAMQRDPGRRYQKVDELAADLRAFLEVRVVRAYETGAWAELRKWVRRNRLASAASVAAVIALVLGLVFSRIEKARADASFALAFDAAAELGDVGYHDLRDASQMDSTRRRVLERAQRFNRAFLELRGDDPAVRQRVATAHHRLCDIQRYLGDYDNAVASGERALSMSQQLVGASPEDRSLQMQLIRVRLTYGDALVAAGRHDDSLVQFETARDAAKALDDAAPSNDAKKLLVNALGDVASYSDRAGNFAAALPIRQRVIQIQNEFEPANEAETVDHAMSHENLGLTLLQLREAQAALEPLAVARDMLEPLVTGGAGRRARFRLAGTLRKVALAKSSLGDRDGALEIYGDVTERMRTLVAQFPDVPAYHAELGGTLLLRGYNTRFSGDPEAAFGMFNEALDVHLAHELVRENARWKQYSQGGYIMLAGCAIDLGRIDEAVKATERAVASPDTTASAWYSASGQMATCAARTDPESAQHETRCKRAVAMIKNAIDGGFKNLDAFQENAYAVLFERADFQALFDE